MRTAFGTTNETPRAAGRLRLAGFLNLLSFFFYVYDWGMYVRYGHFRVSDAAEAVYPPFILASAILAAVAGIMSIRARAWWLAFSAPLVGLSVLGFHLFSTTHNSYGSITGRPVPDGVPAETLQVYPFTPGFYGAVALSVVSLVLALSARSDWPKWARLLLFVFAMAVPVASAVISLLVRFQTSSANIDY